MQPVTGELETAKSRAESVTRACVLILVLGGAVPFAISALYVYYLMPTSYGAGAAAAYSAFGDDRPWLFFSAALWVATVAASVWLLIARVPHPDARHDRGLLWKTVRSILWAWVVVETGMLITAALMSSSLGNIGHTGSISSVIIWQMSLMAGAVALIIASIMALLDLGRAGGPRQAR